MSKKLKKILKKAAPLLAVAGLGKAFMNARNRKAMIDAADANDGFREAFTRPNMLDIAGGATKKKMQNAQDLGFDLSEYDASQPFGFGLMAKKGGRIVKGKKAAVRTKGFAKKKKQANRSKKK